MHKFICLLFRFLTKRMIKLRTKTISFQTQIILGKILIAPRVTNTFTISFFQLKPRLFVTLSSRDTLIQSINIIVKHSSRLSRNTPELNGASVMQSGQNSRTTRSKHDQLNMCKLCAAGGQYVYTSPINTPGRPIEPGSPWHCAIVQCTRTRRGAANQPSAFRAIARACMCVLTHSHEREPAKGTTRRG